MASTMVEVCAFAGTGNVLRVQRLLHVCSEHYDAPEKDERQKDKTDAGAKKNEADASAAAAAAAASCDASASSASKAA